MTLSKITDKTIYPNWMASKENLQLTAIVVQCCKLGALVTTAGAVTGFHLQLIPGGLTQLCQEHICSRIGTYILPCPRTCNKCTCHFEMEVKTSVTLPLKYINFTSLWVYFHGLLIWSESRVFVGDDVTYLSLQRSTSCACWWWRRWASGWHTSAGPWSPGWWWTCWAASAGCGSCNRV